MSTPAGLAIAEEAQTLLTEANANTQAMIDTITAIIRAETIDEIVRAALDTIRKEFGWVYASYWVVDPVENALVFSLESGRVDDEFQRLTRTARFREGEGLNGRCLAAPRPGPRRLTSASCTTAAAPSGPPRRGQDGDRPADHARRPGGRHARLLLDPVRGGLPDAARARSGSSARLASTRSPSWPGRAT